MVERIIIHSKFLLNRFCVYFPVCTHKKRLAKTNLKSDTRLNALCLHKECANQ